MHEIESKKYKGSRLLKVALCCFAFFIVASLIHQQISIADKQEQLMKLRLEVKQQEIKNKEMENAFSDADSYKNYVEKSARKDYNYAKPNEKVIINITGGD